MLCEQAETLLALFALDEMQEDFLYFFGKFPGFELSARLRTFLYPAVRSLSLNLLRKRRRELAALSAAEHGPAETDLPAPDAQRAAVAAVVARLPDDQREIVMLRYVDGMKLSEIARAMNMPLGTVKSALHRALATLRSSLPRP